MKNIFKQLGLIGGFLGVFYMCFVLAGSLLCPKIFMDLGAQQALTKRMFIVGGSNAFMGLRPAVFQNIFPEFTVFGMEGPGIHAQQLRDLFDMVKLTSGGSLKGTVFVIGIGFSQFMEAPERLRIAASDQDPTAMEKEGLKYGLYRIKDNELELINDPHLKPLAHQVLSRRLLWYLLIMKGYQCYEGLWQWVDRLTGRLSPPSIDERTRQNSLILWTKTLGSMGDYMERGREWKRFWSFCQEAHQSGASLVLVDMPMPGWLREHSPYYQKYISKRGNYLKQILTMDQVSYIDLTDHFPDTNFIDSAHPTAQAAQDWGRQVAQFIQSRLPVLVP